MLIEVEYLEENRGKISSVLHGSHSGHGNAPMSSNSSAIPRLRSTSLDHVTECHVSVPHPEVVISEINK